MELKRGDIWLVNLDPTLRHEIKKTRPAVIVQNDLGNKFSPITIILPISSQKAEKVYPFEVFLKKERYLDKDSKVLCNHIRAIDKIRLVRKIGVLSEEMEEVDQALKISLNLR